MTDGVEGSTQNVERPNLQLTSVVYFDQYNHSINKFHAVPQPNITPTPITTHAPSLPVIPNTILTPPNIGTFELHYTAALLLLV